MKRPNDRARGVSLIEALVALAVMAFGMLGVVGMQATLRYNGDIAKQRSEAVRLAQERIENRRAFTVYDSAVGVDAYADIISRAGVDVPGSNATYSLEEAVTDLDGGKTKALVVTVSWKDRSDQTQQVKLGTNITKVLPELGGSLGVPAYGSPSRLPSGRHNAIPRGAVDQGDGTSKFTPPGAGSVAWVFNNNTGFITFTCVGATCTAANARLLAGYIAFATDSSQPTPAMTELPPSFAPGTLIEASVSQTVPVVATVDCYEEYASSKVMAYYCAVPVDAAAGNKWSGQATLAVTPLATSIADPTAASFRVCRYTPVRDAHPTVPTISNEEHPLNYSNVTGVLTQQNFLVIRAGDGATAFTCPADGPLVEINSNTWHHQPST